MPAVDTLPTAVPAVMGEALFHGRQRKAILVVDMVESVRLIARDEVGITTRWTRFTHHVRGQILPDRPREAVRTWPDCVAPADESAALPGILAAGARSGVLVRMNGTSVAAPAGRVARLPRGRRLAGLRAVAPWHGARWPGPQGAPSPSDACPPAPLPGPLPRQRHQAGSGAMPSEFSTAKSSTTWAPAGNWIVAGVLTCMMREPICTPCRLMFPRKPANTT